MFIAPIGASDKESNLARVSEDPNARNLPVCRLLGDGKYRDSDSNEQRTHTFRHRPILLPFRSAPKGPGRPAPVISWVIRGSAGAAPLLGQITANRTKSAFMPHLP